MEAGLAIVISVSLATSMTIAYRHQNLAPVALASAVKIGVLIGLAVPAYLLLYPPENTVLSVPSSASLSGVSNEISLRDALSMISYMLLGSFFMSAFLERVRKIAPLGSGSQLGSYP